MSREKTTPAPGETPQDGSARHGGRTEVNWDGGKGRQPYANQGRREGGPATGGAYEAGDRGEFSGRNLEQLEEVKKKP
jgi:hypothetical protein